MNVKLKNPSFKDLIYFTKNILGKVPYKKFLKELQDTLSELNSLQRTESIYVLSLEDNREPSREEQIEQDHRNDKIAELSQKLIMDVVTLLLDNIENIEEGVCVFFGKMANMTADEFGELEGAEAISIMKEFITQQGGFDSFFNKVSM